MNFRCKLLLLLTAMTAGNALAAEWVALPDAGTGDQYSYDRSKITIKDEEITYWKKVVFKTPQNINGKEAASGLLRERIHCAEHTAKLVSYLYYAVDGDTLEYVANHDSEPAPIIPDTVGDVFERVLCPMVWQKQEETRIKAEQSAAVDEFKKPVVKKEEPKPDVPTPAKPIPPKIPNVRLPEKQPLVPQLPMPQVLDQLY